MAKDSKFALFVERFCALIAATASAAVCWWQWGRFSFPASWKELVGAVFTASATSAGFLFTAASILIAMEARPIMKWGRETGGYALFVGYVTRGVWWCLLAALTTLLMFMPDFTKAAPWHRSLFCFWWASLAGASIAVVRVLLIFGVILHQAAKDESDH
jgi:hypothetical protein